MLLYLYNENKDFDSGWLEAHLHIGIAETDITISGRYIVQLYTEKEN